MHRLRTERGLDVPAIQETKIDREEETPSKVYRFSLRCYAFIGGAVGCPAGCVLFVKNFPGFQVQAVNTYDSGRLVMCDVLNCWLLWRIICVYAPDKTYDRKYFFDNFRNHLTTERLVIIMG